MVWTEFYDSSSGGTTKTDYDIIWIEGTEEEAIDKFVKEFNQSPHEVACECCGSNFSVYEETDLDLRPKSFYSKTHIKIFFADVTTKEVTLVKGIDYYNNRIEGF
jgi:hypothetical protein